MASPAPTDSKTQRYLPFIGALQMDFHRLLHSRLVQIWFAVTILFAMASLLGAAEKHFAASQVMRQVLTTYIVVWSTVVIIICGGTVSSESGVVADAILSRGLTRHGYILSKYMSRLVVVFAAVLLVALPTSYFASAHLTGEIHAGDILLALMLTLLHMGFLTILGVTFSIWFDNAVASIAVLWVICYFLGAVCFALDIAFLSPKHLIMDIRLLLAAQPPLTPIWKVLVGYGIPSVLAGAFGFVWFSRKDV